MIERPRDLYLLQEAPTDLWDLSIKIRNFFNLIEWKHGGETFVMRLMDARAELDYARIILRNMISLENPYLVGESDTLGNTIDNMGRFDARLDEIEKEILDEIKNTVKFDGAVRISMSKIKAYQTMLMQGMFSLVYYPIKIALKKFKESPFIVERDGVKHLVVKDSDLFMYFLFYSISNAYEMLGNVTREKRKKTSNTSFGQADDSMQVYNSKVSDGKSLPDGVKTESKHDFSFVLPPELNSEEDQD